MPNKINSRPFTQIYTLAIFLSGFFFISSTYAAVPTLDQVILNISNNIPQLMRLVTSLAYIMGTYFVIVGVMELKHFGESRTQMSSEHGLKKPIIHLFVGSALIYLPTSIQTGVVTLWGTASPLAYVPEKSSPWSQLISNAFLIIQLIGVIAFIRGLIILTTLGGHGGQHGTFARGLTHIIGGILCINMYDTIQMIAATIGLDVGLGGVLNSGL